MSANNLYYNFSVLKLAPPSPGTPIVVGEIVAFVENNSDAHEEWRAQGRRGPSAANLGDAKRGFTVKTGDLKNAKLVDPKVTYTATLVRYLALPDGTTVGELVTAANAYRTGSRDIDSKSNKYSETSLTFQCLWGEDGSGNEVDPITYAPSTSLTPP